MKKIAYLICSLVVIIGLAAGVSLSVKNGKVEPNDLLLNIIAEIIGISIGTVITIVIASYAAGSKLKELTQPIIDLITQLRIECKISKKTARNCVKCAVKIIGEDTLYEVNPSLSILTKERECSVCGLEAEMTRDESSCKYCFLHVKNWKKQTG